MVLYPSFPSSRKVYLCAQSSPGIIFSGMKASSSWQGRTRQSSNCCHGPLVGTRNKQLLAKPIYSSHLSNCKQDAGFFLSSLTKQVLPYIQINTVHTLLFITAAKKTPKILFQLRSLAHRYSSAYL